MKHTFFLLFLFLFAIKLPSQNPVIVAPSDIVVSCEFPFTPADLTDTLGVLFGKVVFDSNNRKKIYTNDIVCHKMCEPNLKRGYPGPFPSGPNGQIAPNRACSYYQSVFDTIHKDRRYDVVWGLEGYIKYPLKMEVKINVIDNRTCHQGKILRIFSTPGPNNTEIKDTQTIWVVDCYPFNINTENLGHSMVIPSCVIPPPDSMQKPRITEDSCASISISYVDIINTNDPEYYFTVNRQWEIIDYCQFDPNSFPVLGRWTYVDTIFVINHIAPFNTIRVQDCKPEDSTGLGSISISIDYVDNCSSSDFINCSYYIDLNNDGIGKYNGYDIKVGPLTHKAFINGQKPLISDNPFANNPNNPANASGNYPIGKHKVVFETEDGIGNKAKDSVYFVIFPPDPPKFKCPTDDFLIPVYLPKTYVLSINDLLFLHQDNCTPYYNLKAFLDGDPNKTEDVINCVDYLENSSKDALKRSYEVWVQDSAGNSMICQTHVDYLFKGNCDSLKTKYYSGNFFNLKHKEIENLEFDINTFVLGHISYSSGCTNSFRLSTTSTDSAYYILTKKHDFLNNGVDVLDIILLWRHILGIESIENKLSLFAGDINNSKSLTTRDIIDLVIRILHTSSSIPLESDNYWIFFNGRDTSLTKPYLYVSDSVSNFLGIKMGDVNGDALSKCSEQRVKPNACLNFTHGPLNLEKGKSYIIPIFCSNYIDILGMQASFQFDKNSIHLDSILPDQFLPIEINPNDFLTNSGKFNLLYHSNNGSAESLSKNQSLFILKITALQNYVGNDFLKVIDDPTYSIAYDKNENPLNICVNGIPTSTFEIQNQLLIIYPNPTTGDFNIQIPNNTHNFNLKLFNAYGQEVYANENWNSTSSVISISGTFLKEAGAYFVTLQTRERVFNSILIKH